MKLKQTVLLFMMVFCGLFLLTACGSDVKSESEARRVLLTAVTDISEIRNQVSSWDEKTFKQSDIDKVKKQLSKCLSTIHSTDSYKDVEEVKEQYNKAMDVYERAKKDVQKYQKILDKRESK